MPAVLQGGPGPLSEPIARPAPARRPLTLLLTAGPLASLAVAIPLLFGHGISLVDLSIAVIAYAVTTAGITVGYHRLFAHRSFRTGKAVRIALAVAGSLAVEGSVIQWAATHRRHHQFSDAPGDPHSPHLGRGLLRGLWHAHVGWLLHPETTSVQRYAPDLVRDRPLVVIDRLFPLWAVLTFGLPALAGGLLTSSWHGALTALLWGGLVRVFVLHHVTYSINSLCHVFGSRPFDNNDESRNNWWLSVLSFGEAWHNNHHAFPASAWLGLKRRQIDVGGMVISVLERLKLAWHVHKVTPKQLAAKLRAG